MGLESVVRRDGHGSASDRQDKATALLLYKPAIAVQEAVRAITFSRSARPADAACRLRQPTQRTTDGSRRAEHRTPPKLLNELSGSLIGAPAGSDVELALLEVDRRDQPDRLLSNVQLKGRDGELPFILQFNPDAFPAGQRVELRGRVTRAGQLIMRLPPRTISSAASQALGPLQLVPAP